MQETSLVLLVVSTVGFVVFAMVLYAFFKMAKSIGSATKEKPPTQVSFVVDTFHDLVSQLKSKEAELDAMRKRAEDRADVMEDYNENILQSVPSGVVSMDTSWKVVKANASACSILGMDEDKLEGGDGRTLFADIIEDAGSGHGQPPNWKERGEVRHTMLSGRKLWLGYSLSPLNDASGTEIGRLLVFTDLTELKALEEQAALRKRLSSLGEMAAGIAHELRNPMAVIAGYARILSRKVEPAAESTVEAITEEVKVMDRIISDFLSFARPRNLELADINLRALVQSCVEKILGPEKGSVFVEVDIDSGISLEADEVMLRQVLINLATNAIDAVPDGGKVKFSATIGGGDVVLKVSDTGHGIDKAIADRVFNPFYTTKDKGTGLGLALVHRIVMNHSGTIELSSSPEGTTFTITLPREGRPLDEAQLNLL